MGSFETPSTRRTSKLATRELPPSGGAYASVFITDEGKEILPTARHIWDVLRQTAEPNVLQSRDHDESLSVTNRLLDAAEQTGKELSRCHAAGARVIHCLREEDRAARLWVSAKGHERVGLPDVRSIPLSARCDAEENEWRKELKRQSRLFLRSDRFY